MSEKRNAVGLPAPASEFAQKWGFEIPSEMLIQALTHRSFAHENGNLAHNERLEFLGDAVLQIIVTEYLYRAYPYLPEGKLAKMRAATVSQTPLAQVAKTLGLGQFILLGVGEDHGGGRQKDSILSDTVEALIGATYLSSGLETTRTVVEKHLRSLLRRAEERSQVVDWKTTFQESVAKNGGGQITYRVTGSGPDHARHYTAQALVDDAVLGTGQGTSKKQAENYAAQQAVAALAAGENSQKKDATLKTANNA